MALITVFVLIAAYQIISTLGQSTNGRIYIDSVQGHDEDGCGMTYSPCRSLGYSFEHYASKQNSNLVFHFLEGTYNGAENCGLSLIAPNIGEAVLADEIGLLADDHQVVFDCGDDFFGLHLIGWNLTTISGITFQNCFKSGSGGALTFDQTRVEISNCTFRQNEASDAGGGIMIGSDDSHEYDPTVTGVFSELIFQDNIAPYGGAVFFSGPGAVALHSVQFSTNQARSEGGAVFVANGFQQFVNCSWFGNQAKDGGALFIDGSELMQTMVFDGLFAHNNATRGGALLIQGGNNQLENVVFLGNSAVQGGALFFGPPDEPLTHSIRHNNLLVNSSFSNNFAQEGGAVYALGEGKSHSGKETEAGPLGLPSPCRFVNNQAIHGADLFCQRSQTSFAYDISGEECSKEPDVACHCCDGLCDCREVNVNARTFLVIFTVLVFLLFFCFAAYLLYQNPISLTQFKNYNSINS